MWALPEIEVVVVAAEPMSTLTLEDGRTLAYAQWGDASGWPLFHHHGSSSSRLEHPPQPGVLEGVRLLTIDRPGHGLSDFQPERTLLDWPDDVSALADHLGIEQFAVSGWSAGGPYALACAHRMPERLTGVGVISGVAPYDRPAATAGIPVALWHGDADTNSPLAAATYLSRRIPDARLTVFPDEGHFFILKRWGEIIRQLTDPPGR